MNLFISNKLISNKGEEIAAVLTDARGVCRAFRFRFSPCPYTSARLERPLLLRQLLPDSGRSAIVVVRTPDRRGVAALARVAGVELRQRDRILSWRGCLDGRAPRVPGLPTEPASLGLRATSPRRRGGLLVSEIGQLRAVRLAPALSMVVIRWNWLQRLRAACWEPSEAVCPGTASRQVYTRADALKDRKGSLLAQGTARPVQRTARTLEPSHTKLATTLHSRQSPSSAEGRIPRQRAPR